MAENNSLVEQKHRILINSNVRVDGNFINDKNRVDFTISNNQLNDNNINNIGTSKSFSGWTQVTDQGLVINQKFFHYHKLTRSA